MLNKKRKFDYARGSQTFSGHVPFQHFDRWACNSVEQIGDFWNPNLAQNFLSVIRSDPNPVDLSKYLIQSGLYPKKTLIKHTTEVINAVWISISDLVEFFSKSSQIRIRFWSAESGWIAIRRPDHVQHWRVLLKQCFSNFLFHRSPYTLDTSFAPPKADKAHTVTQGSKFKEFYMKVLNNWTKLLNSWTRQLYYDANITFRIVVKIIHTVARHTDDPESKFNG